ncbi:uroporphyrinogen-III C-methyltransferase [Shewanella acanthi]|uniref:uroporphyrinogen-III C-methyltransferase n=1 Tax=Shewanella acanthi TaxID=2864212 RepID=UPI001C6559F4|nr:uroporphyrinogen-III C-methyltransferase [Shewanella acanthi]QYJ79130.1 uroporphyrinogen-III C-methyltransferase [Shewanella acanthi]
MDNKHEAQGPESQKLASANPESVEHASDQSEPIKPETADIPPVEATDATAKNEIAAPKIASTQKADSGSTPTRSSWGIRFGVLLALGISACTIGAGFMLYQQLQQQLVLQEGKNTLLQEKLQQALQQPNLRISQLEQQQANDAKTFQDLSKLANGQSQLHERINKLAQRSPTHWMAAEAEYLVNMAGRKLWLEKDPRTATDLLKSADETIAAMNNPALLPIRKALAKDIAATANMKSVDIDGNVLALDALIEQLDKLPLSRNDGEANAEEDTTISADVSDWQANLNKTWKAITQDFITIRHRTADAPALLAPDQQWYLVENIRHKLLQSQLALYRYDAASYRQSLMMAKQWLQTYFDTRAHQTQETIAKIDELAGLELNLITLTSFAAKPLLLQLTSYGELTSEEEPQL